MRRNIVANFAGNAWVAVLGFVFVPVYLKYIGAEGYGLVGFFSTLSTILAILDGGLGAAGGRELARVTGGSTNDRARSEVRDLVFTIEVLFWGLSAIIGAGIVLAAPFLARRWLNVETLGVGDATQALRLTGLAFMLQWPISLYNGCLIGLQRQVKLNALGAVLATIKGFGALAVLAFVSGTIQAFLAWQVAVGLVSAITMRWTVWRSLPAGDGARAKFSLVRVKEIGRFAAGLSGINVLALVLTQLDKVILSKILPLREFGHYMLAWTLAAMLYRLTGPIVNAVYPRMTQLVASGDKHSLVVIYRRGCQLVAVVLVPAALLMVFYGYEVVFAWTRSADVAQSLRPTLALLALGTMLNALMHLPYSLQLAHGSTGLALRTNAGAVLLIVPLIYFGARAWGAAGGALGWALLNLGYVLTMGVLAHREHMPGVLARWAGLAVLLPIGVGSLVYCCARVAIAAPTSPLGAALVAGAAGIGAGLAVALISFPILKSTRASA